MRRKLIVIWCVMGLALPKALISAPIINDSFNYGSVGSSLESQSSWDDDAAGVNVVAPAFTETASPFTQTGNSIQLNSGRNTHLDITTVAATDYFFSYSIKPGNFGGGAGQWQGLFFENGSNDLYAGFDENGNFITQAHTSPVDSGLDGVTGTEYFILGKVSFADLRNYEISASVYTTAASVPTTEPISWNSTDSFTYGLDQSGLTEFRFQSRGGTSQFDDARFSTDFADVVPEPSTFSLLVAGTFALMCLRRIHNRKL